jgi:hypothetical protein
MIYISRAVLVASFQPIIICTDPRGYSHERRAVSTSRNPHYAPAEQLETTVGEHQQTAALEATEWSVRCRDDRMSMQDRSRYLGWLKRSPMHVAEMLHVFRLYEALRSVILVRPIAVKDSQLPTDLDVYRRFGPRSLH